MRILIAPDSFKGTLSAAEAAAAIARGVGTVRPDAHLQRLPLADGGDGTAAVLSVIAGSRWRPARVTGPLAHHVDAGWLHLADGRAVVEMASASGLGRIDDVDRDPLRTTTRGTGELIRAAVAGGATSVLLALGGSATIDGGVGAARALGWRFLDATGAAVPEGGGGLATITRIVPPSIDPLTGVAIVALYDVETPLVGPDGAARLFGPQKGADPLTVAAIEAGLEHLAHRVDEALGLDVSRRVGGGAAGGLGAGALAFFGATLRSGVATVFDLLGVDEALGNADRVITGEGRFDATSLQGKVVGEMIARARAVGVPVSVLAGTVEAEVAPPPGGVVEVRAVTPDALAGTASVMRAAGGLERAAARWARGWS